MAQIPISDIGRGVMVKSPRRGSPYLKRASYAKGVAPPHLAAYRDKFTEAAHACKGRASGLTGNAAVRAINSCIQEHLGAKHPVP